MMNMDALFNLLFILDYNASKVKWAHGVNSKESLADSIKNTSKISMIESDVILDQTGTRLIMAHPPVTTSDLTFNDWLEAIDKNINVGGKADFKSMAAARKALTDHITLANLTSIKQTPSKLWLNADVAQGPGESDEPAFDGAQFIRLCLNEAPGTVLSLGWTTPLFVDEGEVHADSYGIEEIRRMKKLVQHLPSNTLVSFAVRAKLISQTNLDIFERELMSLSKSYSLTVWTSIADELSKQDILILSNLPKKFGKSRVFYDLPDVDFHRLLFLS